VRSCFFRIPDIAPESGSNFSTSMLVKRLSSTIWTCFSVKLHCPSFESTLDTRRTLLSLSFPRRNWMTLFLLRLPPRGFMSSNPVVLVSLTPDNLVGGPPFANGPFLSFPRYSVALSLSLDDTWPFLRFQRLCMVQASAASSRYDLGLCATLLFFPPSAPDSFPPLSPPPPGLTPFPSLDSSLVEDVYVYPRSPTPSSLLPCRTATDSGC